MAVLLMGPTASGKTAIACALARHLPLEIIGVDSAQVYLGLDVGSAKLSGAEASICPHHLVDIIRPEESYSAARFRIDALRLMEEIDARGRVPLLCGGTMLYFKALREGLSELPGADPIVRREIDERAARLGWPALHAELALIDPDTAARLKPNDAQRIQRALEIVRLTGVTVGMAYAAKPERRPAWRFVAIGLMPSDRAVLHQRIAQRFDGMLANGLIDELVALRSTHKLSLDLPSMRAVGYRQVWEYLDGLYDYETMRQKATAATRQLAKRQMTWMRGMAGIEMIDCLAPNALEQVKEVIARELPLTQPFC
ncbi:MAG: tRNA (adenosine(37)-N6)-dimethylallyltransferase MiaA [Rhodocyclaceae bacterium]